MKVNELQPGDLVHQAGNSATYICQLRHPLWPHLQMVIWRMADGSWSHDALLSEQYVGEAEMVGPDIRKQRLQRAILGIR